MVDRNDLQFRKNKQTKKNEWICIIPMYHSYTIACLSNLPTEQYLVSFASISCLGYLNTFIVLWEIDMKRFSWYPKFKNDIFLSAGTRWFFPFSPLYSFFYCWRTFFLSNVGLIDEYIFILYASQKKNEGKCHEK